MRAHRSFTVLLVLSCLSCISQGCRSAEPVNTAFERSEYRSPYAVRLAWTLGELIPDLIAGERGDPSREGRVAAADWYTHGGRGDTWVGPWGPLPRVYLPPAVAEGKSDDWKRARVIATALRFLGYHYRHHHIPDWNPPAGWYEPKPGGTPHPGKGVDCSNFTAFVYNQALGLGLNSDVHQQAVTTAVTVQGEGRLQAVSVIPTQHSVDDWKAVLQPGDLLFIRPRNSEEISHVVIWIGAWSAAPAGESLILDSHGADVRDINGAVIPDGVFLRPFRPGSWYATRASHALRIIGP